MSTWVSTSRPRLPPRAIGGNIHVARGCSRCGFPVIDRRGVTIRKPDQHEPSASEIACLGIDDSQRQSDGTSRIDGVSTVFENADSNFRGDSVG